MSKKCLPLAAGPWGEGGPPPPGGLTGPVRVGGVRGVPLSGGVPNFCVNPVHFHYRPGYQHFGSSHTRLAI